MDLFSILTPQHYDNDIVEKDHYSIPFYHVLHLQESVEEWLRPEKSYKLLEMTIRVLKAGDHNQFLDHESMMCLSSTCYSQGNNYA